VRVAGVDRLEAAVTELVRAARRPLHDAPVAATADLTEVVRERSDFWSVLAEEDGRPWSVEAPDRPVAVRADAAELAAALDALLANVHGHTPAGTAYRLTLRTEGGRARLEVADDGPGIADPEEAQRRGRSGGGSTGLGLDIAARTAAAAGGELRVEASDAGGTLVVLDLPVAT